MAEKEANQANVKVVEPVRKPHLTAEDRRKRLRLQEVEQMIDQLEADLAAVGHRLEDPPTDTSKVQKLGTEYVRIQKELEALMDEWSQLHG